MPKILLQPHHRTISCETGENLLDILRTSGIDFEAPCNGNGTCGKCRVTLLDGNLTIDTDREHALLDNLARNEGQHLACLSAVNEDIEIRIAAEGKRHNVLEQGFIPEFEKDPNLTGYGLAVDIGTTTVVASLLNLQSGKELATASAINPQKAFGLDVLSRITFEYEHGQKGIDELQNTIVTCLNSLAKEACAKAHVRMAQLNRMHVAANCAMMHMLLGEDARPLGRAPYTPTFTQARTLSASKIGLKLAPNAELYCLPQVSAYVGADIVAGAYVGGLQTCKGKVLLIDIGTNGEIVIASQGKLWCCSCAAGPALEGMNISSGMRAAEGAIEDIGFSPDGIRLKTIGDAQARGLCGSGILAAVKELLQAGFLQKRGAFVKPENLDSHDWRRRYLTAEGVKRFVTIHEHPRIVITQNDIRQVQLAKGALLSGVIALLEAANTTAAELDSVLVAGQFGAHLPAESLIGAGILPPETADKIIYIGNSSKTGACLSLLSSKARHEMEELAKQISYFELAETQDYDNLFARCMMFGDEGCCKINHESKELSL